MIKLNNLQKYFNKNKKNQIHVLNDISLELPDKGLVVLLGPSGSGKTTLLNVLGGLDKVQDGAIEFDDVRIDKYNAKVWDNIRNKHVGYIFQNYNLLTNLTVYDNISFTLNMIGVVDKDEIDKRIDYLLDNMGMGNFRKRRASQLSGGQQQRVAIARALAKNPKVIIADEPTGNLDSKNTIDIMNIIKQISKEKLVVLVTHEKDIANFYADRIIELQDGVIVSDKKNSSEVDLELRHETDIYLKDLNQHADLGDESLSVKSYSDREEFKDISVKLILKGNKLFLDVDALNIEKVQLLDKNSEVNVYDKHFESVSRDSMIESTFDYDEVVDESKTINKHSVISFKETLKLAFNKVKETTRGGKILYVGFAGAAVLIAIASGLIFGIFHIEDDEFLEGSKDNVVIRYNEQTFADLMDYEEQESIDYVNFMPNKITFKVELPKIYEYNYRYTDYGFGIKGQEEELSAKPEIYSELKQSDIILGSLPTKANDIVIDKAVFTEALSVFNFDSSYSSLGIDEIKDFIKLDYYFDQFDYTYEFNITGISDSGFAGIYLSEELLYSLLSNIGVYEYFDDSITLIDGDAPDEYKELLIAESLNSSIASFEYIVDLETTLTASGEFEYNDGETGPQMLMRLDDVRRFVFEKEYTQAGQKIYINASNVKGANKFFKGISVESYSDYDTSKQAYFDQVKLDSMGIIIFSLVVLGASSLSYYFIIRSSLISRIYEISVYRALGVSKMDIRKIFVTEIILKTTISSTVGFLATSWFLIKVQSIAADYYEFIYFTFWNVLLGLVVIYTINIIAGLIPVSDLLRKTPAEILSKYDL